MSESPPRLSELVGSFLQGGLTAPQFEAGYMNEWRRCRDYGLLKSESPAVQNVYDAIFTTLDAYCSDPELRGPRDIDEQQMKVEVSALFAEVTGLR